VLEAKTAEVQDAGDLMEEARKRLVSLYRESHDPRKSGWTVVRVRPARCPARHNEAE
jgi:hypothetical protein